jgi:hypothetical protein
MDSKKYIGMDVHKEAISIAVLNASGKLVMESIIATKAITIVEFLEGLRGELHVTFEEGTWSTWLYDLLKPHARKIVVCNPRRNALLKEGSKNDRIDARKLAELLYTNMLRPVYHGENGVNLERTGTGLSDHQPRCRPRHDPRESSVSELGDSLFREASLRATSPFGMAGQDRGGRRTSAGRVLLSATGRAAIVAPGSTPRSFDRERPAQGDETATPDSIDRSHSGRSIDCHPADPASLPHQATAVDLQRLRH